ncbi:MAG: DivIVA protein [Microbacteriaceae bacterium]|nr:DivIVA protein [Microbacteriaceae bacterium]
MHNGPVSTTFPRTRKSQHGYRIDQVEDFLEDARRAYSVGPNEPAVVSAANIRQMAFALERGGYSPTHVDAALERLEDAFASRERERAIQERGDEAWYTEARSTAREIMDRLLRPAGQRFNRTGLLSEGYNTRDVDAFAEQLITHFRDGRSLSIEDVRNSAFRTKRGGYQEAQVDLLLDTVVHVMLAVR